MHTLVHLLVEECEIPSAAHLSLSKKPGVLVKPRRSKLTTPWNISLGMCEAASIFFWNMYLVFHFPVQVGVAVVANRGKRKGTGSDGEEAGGRKKTESGDWWW